MKKYVVVLSFLVVQNMCAMELEQLSPQDDAKALRLAKLFNKYPNGYGEDKNQIDECKEAINYFLNKSENSNVYLEERFCRYSSKDIVNQERIDVQKKKKQFFQQFEILSARVKQYQNILNNMEAVELLDCIHEKLLCNAEANSIKSRIFAAALRDYTGQYYATSNAMKFVILEPFLAFAGYYSGVMDVCYPCFFAEWYADGKPTICFSDDGFKCELHCVDRSIVKAYSEPCYTGSVLRLKKPNQKAFASDLIAFMSQDSKNARNETLTKLFKSWIEYLANETNKQKCTNRFIELLKRLNWHDIELFTAEDCKEVLKRESTLHNIGSWS